MLASTHCDVDTVVAIPIAQSLQPVYITFSVEIVSFALFSVVVVIFTVKVPEMNKFHQILA